MNRKWLLAVIAAVAVGVYAWDRRGDPPAVARPFRFPSHFVGLFPGAFVGQPPVGSGDKVPHRQVARLPVHEREKPAVGGDVSLGVHPGSGPDLAEPGAEICGD